MKALGAAFSLVLAAGTAQAQVSVTKTGAFTRMQCATPSISTAYSAGQQVGPGIVMGNVFRADGPNYGGTLMSITLTSKSLQTTAFKLYQYDQNPSASGSHLKAPIALTAADSGLGGGATVYGRDNINRAIGRELSTSDPNDYWVIVTTGDTSFASASDLTLCVTYQLD